MIGTPLNLEKKDKPTTKKKKCSNCGRSTQRQNGYWFCNKLYVEMNKDIPLCKFFIEKTPKTIKETAKIEAQKAKKVKKYLAKLKD